MKNTLVVVGVPFAMLCASVVSANAAGSIAGKYACGFGSPSGYVAPGTNSSVPVSGIFTLTIGKDGSISQSDTTISVSDGGAGTAVCDYEAGTGEIAQTPLNGRLGTATLSSPAQNGSSPLCPSGDASLTFSPTQDGLKFIYSSTSGFIGTGECELGATPAAASFDCTYHVKDATLGEGSGTGSVLFVPRLNQKAIFLNIRNASVFGSEIFSGRLCPFLGPAGISAFQPGNPGTGTWTVPTASIEGCPTPRFSQVKFASGAKTIFITTPGMLPASCAPGVQLTSKSVKIDVSPNSLDFGPQSITGTSDPKLITIKNSGTEPLDVQGFAVLKNAFDQTNDCPDNGELAPGASCTVQVTFAPKVKGNIVGSLQIINSADPGSVTVKLKGSGRS